MLDCVLHASPGLMTEEFVPAAIEQEAERGAFHGEPEPRPAKRCLVRRDPLPETGPDLIRLQLVALQARAYGCIRHTFFSHNTSSCEAVTVEKIQK